MGEMKETLEALMFRGAVILAIALHAALFFRLAGRVRDGTLSRGKAVGLYALVGLVPTVTFVGVFLALVGAEEFFAVALISEGFGRGSPIIVGVLLLLWILSSSAFTIYCVLSRRLR